MRGYMPAIRAIDRDGYSSAHWAAVKVDRLPGKNTEYFCVCDSVVMRSAALAPLPPNFLAIVLQFSGKVFPPRRFTLVSLIFFSSFIKVILF